MEPAKHPERVAEADGPITRRSMLMLGSLMAAGAMLPAMRSDAAATAGKATGEASLPLGVPTKMDARGVELYMKLHAASADAEVPWFYTGRIYAIRERQAPVHLFNLEGCEIYWVRRTGEDEWITTSSTLTFYRDPITGAYLDSYTNPLTGRTLPVSPNVLRTPPGKFSKFSPAGHEASREVLIPWQVETHANGGVVWLVTSRYALNMPQPWLEVQTIMGSERELADPRVTYPAATFSSSYSAPWLGWMDMGDAPGHLLWHSSGRKLASLAELPESYRARAERLGPGHFEAPGKS
jgi:hypothetical protein